MISQKFFNTGAMQTFVVPDDVTAIGIKVWGAAGGPQLTSVNRYSQGGAGGYAAGTLDVTPGQVLQVMVGSVGVISPPNTSVPTFGGGGAGGSSPTGSRSVSGGGRSGVAFATGTQFIIAGGGGGAGSGAETSPNLGGNGGGPTGNTVNILSGGTNLTPATGGTQTNGGLGGINGVNPAANGSNGVSLQGGRGGNEAAGFGAGGGGGGGYFGGGGGNGSTGVDQPTETAGAGGSGYVNTSILRNTINQATPQGTALGVVLPPNTSDPDYVIGVGVANGATGTGAGLVVFNYTVGKPLNITKRTSREAGKVGDSITYELEIKNTSTTPATNIVITDPIPTGTSYIPLSITANVPITGDPTTTITLTNPIAPGESVKVSYQVQINTMPNPNPIPNTAVLNYNYNPTGTEVVAASATSNTVDTIVFDTSRGIEFI